MSRITHLLPPDPPPIDRPAELRPCPFCGGVANLNDVTPSLHASCRAGSACKEFTVKCGDDNCQVYVVVGPCKSAVEAIEVWNTRKGWKL